MLLLNKYDLSIFDCDGVILDSNNLKVEAMKEVLENYLTSKSDIESCIDYFKNNFGKSRFHHINYFLNNFFKTSSLKRENLEKDLIQDFSLKCYLLYQDAELCPDLISVLTRCSAKKFVASGSEQNELRAVFKSKDIAKYFYSIFGSPTPKEVIVKNILDGETHNKAVMIGDSFSDMLSAEINKIDFIFYAPYSNVKQKMIEECISKNYRIIYSLKELIEV